MSTPANERRAEMGQGATTAVQRSGNNTIFHITSLFDCANGVGVLVIAPWYPLGLVATWTVIINMDLQFSNFGAITLGFLCSLSKNSNCQSINQSICKINVNVCFPHHPRPVFANYWTKAFFQRSPYYYRRPTSSTLSSSSSPDIASTIINQGLRPQKLSLKIGWSRSWSKLELTVCPGAVRCYVCAALA